MYIIYKAFDNVNKYKILGSNINSKILGSNINSKILGGEYIFTDEDLNGKNIPIASVSKLVLACIIKFFEDKLHKSILNNEFHISRNLTCTVDEILHMKSGIVFSISGSGIDDCERMFNILNDYNVVYKPVSYSNCAFIYLALKLEQLIGVNYENALKEFCDELELKNTWSYCRDCVSESFKPGSGDIVSNYDDLMKIGKYIGEHFDWFYKNDKSTVRGRGCDVTYEQNGKKYIGKDGGNRVPHISGKQYLTTMTFRVSEKQSENNNIVKSDSNNESVMYSKVECISYTNINGKEEINIQNSEENNIIIKHTPNGITKPFCTDFVKYNETVHFDEKTQFCVDVDCEYVMNNRTLECKDLCWYKVFNFTDFNIEFPEYMGRINKLIIISKKTFDIDCTCNIINKCILNIMFNMHETQYCKTYIIDNVKNNIIYIRCPFENACRPYGKICENAITLYA